MMFGFALSGLQEFLYDLSPESQSRDQRGQEGGRDRDSARRLRIRSAVLTLIPGLVAYDLLARDANAKIVYLGGGKLLMEGERTAVEKLIAERLVLLYKWLASHSAGKLGAYWSQVDGGADKETLKALLAELAKEKWRAGRGGVKWRDVAGRIETAAVSSSLGHRDWESTQGADFARREDWKGFKVGEGDWQIGPWHVRPVTDNPDIALAGKAQAAVEVSIPTYTPKKNEETIPLFELAEEDADGNTRGGAYLALLKLDGDGIGNLMKAALDESLTQYAKVSGQLSSFFGPDMTGLLKREFPRIYLVYSGGDDLVACGWFDEVIRAALEIRERYEKLNLSTVSAGISFFTRQSSILKAIEAAEEELENAKKTRDAVSLGGCRLSWEEMRKTLGEVDGLEAGISNESINRGAFNLLRQLGEPWLPDAPASKSDQRFRSIPMMHYMRSRRTGWKESDWPSEVKALFDSLQIDDTDWPRASLVGTLAAWRTKRRQEEE